MKQSTSRITAVAVSLVVGLASGVRADAPTLKGRNFLTLPGDQWKLIFQDEFAGSKLDTTKWTIGLPWTGDDGTNRHHNPQYASVITDEDVQVFGGMLHLTSRKTDVLNPKGGVYKFTEGLITTSGKFEARYGYFEMRAKLPTEAGPGTWPAFWTLSKGWPPEMDILEYWGSNNRIHQGTVTRKPDGGQRWDSYHLRQVSLSGWHTYGMEWGPSYQIYNIDGQPTNTIYGGHLPDMPHYLLLNSGVESARPPRPSTVFPNDFVVDWVRVYARPDTPALLNGGFEAADSLLPWTAYNEAVATDYGARSGKRCLRLDSGGQSGDRASAAAQQTVYGLKPNTRYTLTAQAKTLGGAIARLGVKEHGSEEVRSTESVTQSRAYRPLSLTFTTGPSASSATLYCWSEGEGSAFFDDVRLETSGQ